MTFFVVNVALPVPLRRTFDYLPQAGQGIESYPAGLCVRVQFAGQLLTGVVLHTATQTDVPANKLKAILATLDPKPLLGAEELQLAHWLSEYYHHSLGAVLELFLPAMIRRGAALAEAEVRSWRKVQEPNPPLKSAKQQALWSLFADQALWAHSALTALGFSLAHLKKLQALGLIQEEQQLPIPSVSATPSPSLILNNEQQQALDALSLSLGRFQPFLLEGITGSGKTEVYLRFIQAALDQGKQALVLVPEIGLTPQTVRRFQARFHVPVALLHSGLNDRERLQGWRQAKEGVARILIGTRSAIFTPMPELGLIIIDEEHDGSFKQQDGLRYNARDFALVRARNKGIPILLGSATPALETLHNALTGKYQHLELKQRAGGAKPPSIKLHNIQNRPMIAGFSQSLLPVMRDHLARNKQVLVFLNRRGYAPLVACQNCGWLAQCRYCDARLTLHQSPSRLQCHHCDYYSAVPHCCPQCQGALVDNGLGTEKVQEALRDLFPNVPIHRVDRDSISGKQAFDRFYEEVHKGEAGILVGTQMLAKGHHFPDVTLVVILDADTGLFSHDFRGLEHSAQLIEQVAGRAGREQDPGEVWIQTLYAAHPMLNLLVDSGYHALALALLAERAQQGLPPYSRMAMLASDSSEAELARTLLQQARAVAEQYLRNSYPQHSASPVQLLGPSPAIMERRAGRFRFQLQCFSADRQALHKLLHVLTQFLEAQKPNAKLRWHFDIDPMDIL